MPDDSKTSCDTIVVGAGISGLSTAYGLQKKGMDVALLEASGRSGGVIESRRIGSFLLEYGPNSLLKKSREVEELISELDLGSEVQVAGDQASRRYVVRDDQLHPVPMSVSGFLNTDLLSWGGKLSLLLEPLRKPGGVTDDEALSSFVTRRLGHEALTYLVNPMVAGIYAGDPNEMSALSAAEKFARWEREYGSVLKGAMTSKLEQPDRTPDDGVERELISFRGGLETLTERLSERLSNVFRHNHRVESVARSSHENQFRVVAQVNGTSTKTFLADQLILSIPAYNAADLLEPVDQEVSSSLKQIDYPPVSVVHFGYETYDGDHPLDGFGFLVPEAEQCDILGSLWNATIFPDRAPEGGAVFTTFVGGARQPDLARKSDDELVSLVRSDLNDLVGVDQSPDVVHIKRWKRAIPQYNLGHQQIMEEVERFEEDQPGIHIRSNFRDSASVPGCITNGMSLADEIVQNQSGELSS
jgi:oxygen-dependent protoporphyrinogen oxidase